MCEVGGVKGPGSSWGQWQLCVRWDGGSYAGEDDGLVTQDECTPFHFSEDGVLLGWGNKYFREQGIMSVWTQKAINSAVWFY